METNPDETATGPYLLKTKQRPATRLFRMLLAGITGGQDIRDRVYVALLHAPSV